MDNNKLQADRCMYPQITISGAKNLEILLILYKGKELPNQVVATNMSVKNMLKTMEISTLIEA